MAWWVYVSATQFIYLVFLRHPFFSTVWCFMNRPQFTHSSVDGHQVCSVCAFVLWIKKAVLSGVAWLCGLTVLSFQDDASFPVSMAQQPSHALPPPPHALSRSPLLLLKPFSTHVRLQFCQSFRWEVVSYHDFLQEGDCYLLFFCYHPFLPISGF